jgi:hypothetical protein
LTTSAGADKLVEDSRLVPEQTMLDVELIKFDDDNRLDDDTKLDEETNTRTSCSSTSGDCALGGCCADMVRDNPSFPSV